MRYPDSGSISSCSRLGYQRSPLDGQTWSLRQWLRPCNMWLGSHTRPHEFGRMSRTSHAVGPLHMVPLLVLLRFPNLMGQRMRFDVCVSNGMISQGPPFPGSQPKNVKTCTRPALAHPLQILLTISHFEAFNSLSYTHVQFHGANCALRFMFDPQFVTSAVSTRDVPDMALVSHHWVMCQVQPALTKCHTL